MTVEIPLPDPVGWFWGIPDLAKLALMVAVYYMVAAVVIRVFDIKPFELVDTENGMIFWSLSPAFAVMTCLVFVVFCAGWVVSLGLIVPNPVKVVRSMWS